MDGRLFVVAAVLLSCCPGTFGDSKLKTVRAFTGESVILPCIADIFDDTTTVMWSKVGLRKYVLLFNQDVEIHEEKDPAFWYRSSLIMNELKNKNVSVRISDLKLSDAGTYTCMTIHKQIPRSTAIELIVGAVSEPKLSSVPSTDDGLTLQCEVQCWFPKPEITFLDDAGKEMSAHDKKTELRPEGCYNITWRVTLETATNSVTCLVNEQSLNQSKAVTLMTHGFRTSYTNIIIAIVVSAVIVCFSILGAAFFYMKHKNVQRQRSSAPAVSLSSGGGHTNHNSTAITEHPENNEVVPQLQTEQPNEENSSPCEVDDNISGSSQVLAQGSSTQGNPNRFTVVRFDVASSSDDEYNNLLTWPCTVKREGPHRSYTIPNFKPSSSVTEHPEEEENPLLSTNP